MNSVNYNSGPTPQMLGAAMMPMDVQNAAPSQNAQAMGGVPQMSPQTLQTMMQSNQYSPGYVDQSGVSGQTLAANGIAPGPSGLLGNSGLLGLQTSPLLGGGGNPLSLSGGSQFSPEDIAAITAAFAG